MRGPCGLHASRVYVYPDSARLSYTRCLTLWSRLLDSEKVYLVKDQN